MNEKVFQSFDDIAIEALAILRSGVPVLQAYPILRQVEPLRVQRFGPSKWPGLLFQWSNEKRMFEVATSEPHLDRHFSGEFNELEVTKEEDRELCVHLAIVLESWIRESRRQASSDDEDEKRYREGLRLWNEGNLSWADITEKLEDDRTVWKAFSQAIKRYAANNELHIRTGKPGSKRKGTNMHK